MFTLARAGEIRLLDEGLNDPRFAAFGLKTPDRFIDRLVLSDDS